MWVSDVICERSLTSTKVFLHSLHWENRCQFHQHFTSSFLVQKCLCVLCSFSLITFWPCNFSPQGIRKRLLVKCWWNWLQDVEMSTMHHEEIDVKCRLSDCCLCLSTSLSTLVQSYKQDRKKSQFLFNLISISLVFVWDFFKCTWLKVSTNTFCRNKNTCCST